MKASTEKEVDRLTKAWHDLSDEEWAARGYPSLSQHLGWTESEYRDWFEQHQLPKE